MCQSLSASERAMSAFANLSTRDRTLSGFEFNLKPARTLSLLRAAREGSDPFDTRLIWRFLATIVSCSDDDLKDERNEALLEARRLRHSVVTGSGGSRVVIAAATMLECIVTLRFSSSLGVPSIKLCSHALDLAVSYSKLRPADIAGHRLVALAAGAVAIARVTRSCSAFGGGWVHLLPHPLSCFECGGPGSAPHTCALGFLRCKPCAKRSAGGVATTTAANTLISGAFPVACEVGKLRLAGNDALALGNLKVAARLFEEAITLAANASSAPPLAHTVYSNLSVVLMQQGRWDPALTAALRAANEAPVTFWKGELRCASAFAPLADYVAGAITPLRYDSAIAALMRAVARAALAQVCLC
jgi:hypothetical protein